MAKYNIEYKFVLEHNYVVEADSEEEARTLLELSMNMGEIPFEPLDGEVSYTVKGENPDCNRCDISEKNAARLKEEYPDEYEDLLQYNQEEER